MFSVFTISKSLRFLSRIEFVIKVVLVLKVQINALGVIGHREPLLQELIYDHLGGYKFMLTKLYEFRVIISSWGTGTYFSTVYCSY